MSDDGRSAAVTEGGMTAKVFWDRDQEAVRIELDVGGILHWLDYEDWVLLTEGIRDGWKYVNGSEAAV